MTPWTQRCILLSIAAGLVACSESSPIASKAAAVTAVTAVTAVPVEVVVIRGETLNQELTGVGSLRSDESVTLRSEVAGRIERINFREGAKVAAGQLLFELDSAVNQAELSQAQANSKLAQRNDERAQELFGRSLISQSDRDTAAANREVARAALALAQARLGKTRITAPFAGVAGLRMVSPGDYVSAGQSLVNLEAMSLLKADFRLPEAALSQLRVGQPLQLELDAFPGEVFTGELYAIEPRVADDTRSIGLRARLPNPDGKLRPGLFARIKLQTAQNPSALMVPEQAVTPRGSQQFVYVVEDGKAQLREVRLGQRIPGRVEIVSGLDAGAVVITSGLQQLTPGVAVQTAADATARANDSSP
jgi:membrane fusion protein (multidrug efflux system)